MALLYCQIGCLQGVEKLGKSNLSASGIEASLACQPENDDPRNWRRNRNYGFCVISEREKEPVTVRIKKQTILSISRQHTDSGNALMLNPVQ